MEMHSREDLKKCLSSGMPISFSGWQKNSALLVPCLYTLIITASTWCETVKFPSSGVLTWFFSWQILIEHLWNTFFVSSLEITCATPLEDKWQQQLSSDEWGKSEMTRSNYCSKLRAGVCTCQCSVPYVFIVDWVGKTVHQHAGACMRCRDICQNLLRCFEKLWSNISAKDI